MLVPEGVVMSVLHRRSSRPPSRFRSGLVLLGPAFVAAIAYVDPGNVAAKLIEPGRVEAVAGVNLPMLLRVLTYRERDMDTLLKRAVSGGCEGVLHIESNLAP